MTAFINHEGAVWYLGEAAEGVLHSRQDDAGLLLREQQIPAYAEQSCELGRSGVSTGGAEDLGHCGSSTAALGIRQQTDEAASGYRVAGTAFFREHLQCCT